MSGSPAPWLAMAAVLASSLLSSDGARPQGPSSSKTWFALPFTKFVEFQDLSQAQVLAASAVLGDPVFGPEALAVAAPLDAIAAGPAPPGNATATRAARRAARRAGGGGSLAEVRSSALNQSLPEVSLPDPSWVLPSSMSVLAMGSKVREMTGNGTAIQEAWMDILFDLLAGEDGNITAHEWNITFNEPTGLGMFNAMDRGGTGKVNRTAFKSGWGAGVDAMEMVPQPGGDPPPMRVAMEMAIFEELLFHALVNVTGQAVSWERVQSTAAKDHFGKDEASFKKEFGNDGMTPEGLHEYLVKVGALTFPIKKDTSPSQPSAASPSAAAALATPLLLLAAAALAGGGERGGG